MNIIFALFLVPALLIVWNVMAPSAVFPAWIHTGAVNAGGYIKGLNGLINTDYLFLAVGVVILIEFAILVWKGFKLYMGWTLGSGQ